jgi:hypothetical protein
MNRQSLLSPHAIRSLLVLLVGSLIGVVAPLAHAERTVTLAWEAGADDAAGYFVYAVEENSTVPVKLDVGGNTRAVVSGLKEGLCYTFYVTAYSPVRIESAPSVPIAFKVPVPLEMRPPTGGAPGRVRFPAAPGRWYELQASTDLVNWTTIWQTGMANNYAWMEYQDPRARYYTSRFYRLQVH